MSNIIPFQYQEAVIRTVVDDDGETLWVAKDVAEVLGYKRPNDAIQQHCRGAAKYRPIVDSLGRFQDARVLHEPDLYRLITNSQLEGAARFEAWVFEEVLPSLRKTGTYSIPGHIKAPSIPKIATDFKAFKLIALTAGLKGNPAVLSANAATRRLHGQDPLALIGVTHLITEEQKRHFTASELGLMFGGMSGMKFNLLLADKGLQESKGTGKKKYWEPTEKGRPHAILTDTGKQHSNGSMVQQLRWLESVLDAVKEVAA